ncbi:hypothetical protein M0Q50_09075 [bacterium]|jgi:hypothetical protein|nr:hypothetical protein [bacterium]
MNEIFNTSRVRFNELYQDSLNFIKNTYGNLGQYFTLASPMGQLLQVILNYGRMILFYNEDSITESNIKTATRPQNVKGISTLTGHNPSRAMAARGTLSLNYNGTKLSSGSKLITIPNFTQLINNQNGLTYTIILPGEEALFDLTSVTNTIDVNIIQGKQEFQQSTGTGDPLQSFNFQNKKGASIDNYYVNVYVNGVKWKIVDSILDMTLNEQAVMIKTGETGGIDIFFGNEYNGAMPEYGSTILVEYLITDGTLGNLNTMNNNLNNTWKFSTTGYLLSGEELDLNKYINISIKNEIMFGATEEPLYLTRLLAPHVSRSFVLANENNYIYFLRKLNIFTIIDAIPGFATFEDQYVYDKYNQAKGIYEDLLIQYRSIVSTYGVNSKQAISIKTSLDNQEKLVNYYSVEMNNQKKDDNTVYLFLVPDVTKRIATGDNYYTCSLSAFILSDSEKLSILDLIEQSGQRILTVDNAILDLKFPKFTLNMSLILWEGSIYDTVRQDIISKTSDYFLKNTRRDRIPVSDLVKIIENVDGVDSVNVWFDADKENLNIYKTYYGIDDYGDIVLERYVTDAFNNNVPIKDVYPLIRGGFENSQGTYYEDSLVKNKLSTLNIQIRGYTSRNINSENNIAIINNI